MLEDTNNDGMTDDRTEFAKHLKFCHSLLAGAERHIGLHRNSDCVSEKDTDDDNVADLREVWFDGFTPAIRKCSIGCPRYGFDNWIDPTYGHGKVRLTHSAGFSVCSPSRFLASTFIPSADDDV